MSGENIRLACVGLGRWAGVLAEGVRKTPGLRIAACHTRSDERKEAFARKYGCRPYPDYAAILEDPDVDAVVLTTPHSAHQEQVLAAARAGKHVFVEKPITVTLGDARACVEACERAGVVLMVGHCWRWVASVQKAKSLLDAGALGEVTQAAGHFGNPRARNYGREIWRDDPEESPLGPFTGPGFHLLDILKYLLGPVEEAFAVLERKMASGRIPDTASGVLRFVSGPIAQVSSSFVTPRRYQLSLFGTEANLYVNADPGGGTPAAPALVIHRRDEEAPEVLAVEKTDMIARHMASFAESVRGEAPPFTDGREGAALVALLSAMLESSETGGWTRVETL